jgi:hypothetical protein
VVVQTLGALLTQWGDLVQLDGLFPRLAVAADSKTVFGLDMSIESLRSQQYSYFIFGFLVVSLIIFCAIIFLYLPKKGGRLKTGEKIMFGAIIMGVLIALGFGYLQLIEGFLV